jgi:hypothetical protein
MAHPAIAGVFWHSYTPETLLEAASVYFWVAVRTNLEEIREQDDTQMVGW